MSAPIMRSHSSLNAAAEPLAGYRPQRAKTRVDKAMQALARSPIGGWLFINVFPVIDRWLIPHSRGRLKVALGQPVLLLHTRGARSGQPRISPLLYTPRGDSLVIVASRAGDTRHPAWYHNLRAHPERVTIEVDGTHSAVRPRVAQGPEREALWRLVNDNYNGYDAYQARAGERLIPIVVLEPKESR
jgi:deazaflavin-dependent oxidoreductase (nitroreductase family)